MILAGFLEGFYIFHTVLEVFERILGDFERSFRGFLLGRIFLGVRFNDM